VPILLSGADVGRVKRAARHIHDTVDAGMPFAEVSARGFPEEAEVLIAFWLSLVNANKGGSVLVTDIEQASASVQRAMADLVMYCRERARLLTGTTERLFERVQTGEFSSELFYRLNVCHLVEGVDF
jgi:hypothetical protein